MRFSLEDIDSEDPNSPFWQYMMSRPGWQQLVRAEERYLKNVGVHNVTEDEYEQSHTS